MFVLQMEDENNVVWLLACGGQPEGWVASEQKKNSTVMYDLTAEPCKNISPMISNSFGSYDSNRTSIERGEQAKYVVAHDVRSTSWMGLGHLLRLLSFDAIGYSGSVRTSIWYRF